MTATLGAFLHWSAAVALAAAAVLSLRRRDGLAIVASRVGAVLAAGAVAALAWALTTGDLTMAYVAAVTDRATSWPHRLAGLWGGMGGSLLLWSAMVAAWVWRRPLGPVERAAIAGLGAAFLGIGAWLATPWHVLDAPALDGLGPTPILRHPAMLYHPPLLYLGLTGLVVPWAATIGAAFDRGAASGWLARARRQLLAVLGVLTVGMVAGAHWAYVELGWGGYWAWDPVENTALLPWLAALGAVHGVVRARRGDGGARAAGLLAGLALALAVLGTMLTRSGAAPSVHAFGEDAAVGRALVALTLAVVVVTVVAAARLRPVPPLDPGRPPAPWAAWALRLQPVLAAVAVVVVLAGTVRPLLGDDEVAVAGHYYSTLLAPVAVVALVLALRFRPGHLAHLAAAVFALGLVGSMFASSTTATLAPGESLTLRGWEVENLGAAVSAERTVSAPVVLRRDGDEVAILEPSLVSHPDRGVLLAETSLRSTPLTDVQVALRDADDDGRALLEVHVRPLVWFVWWGPLLLALACGRAALASGPPRVFGARGSDA